MRFTKMSEAMEYSLKVYKILTPILFGFFLVMGLCFFFLIPNIKFVAYIMIGIGIFMVLMMLFLIAVLKRRIAKLKEEDN